MKKITLLFFMFLCSMAGYSQLAQEGFEGAVWPPAGWNVYNIAGPQQEWVQGLVANGQPAFEGIGTAYLNRENVAAGTMTEDYLVTPLFNVPTNPQLKFMSRLTIGGVSAVPTIYRVMLLPPGLDASVPANYVQLEQWGELEINPSQEAWIQVNVTDPIFTGYVGQQVRLAFVMLGDNGDRWLVDNVQVVSECVPPAALTANGITLTSANLSWSNPSGATEWDVEIVPVADAPTGNPTHAHSGALPFPVTGLAQATCFKYYVRAKCSPTNFSTWAGPFNFCTVAPGATCNAPWVVSALPFSTTNTTSNFGDDYNGSPGATGCGSTFGYLDGDDVVYAYTPTTSGVVSIDMTNNGGYSGLFVYDDCADIGVSCIAGGVASFTPTPVSIPSLSVIAGTTYYIVISTWAAPQSTPYTLVIQAVNCAPPVGLPTTSIGQTSANLSWTNPSSATAWEVVVQAPGGGIPPGSGVAVATNTNYPATGLTPATPYEYWVRASCGNGTFSAWAGPYLFNTTICEAVDQCNYSFVMTDSFGDGWNGNTMTVSQNGITIATIGSTFTTGVGPVTVTVPVCNNLPIQLYWNSGGSWAGEVGVTIQNSYGQPIYTKAPGTGTQNSLLYTGTVDCNNPACLAPNGLTATNIGTTTANIGWTGPATGAWEYYVVPQGDPAPTAATPGIATTSNPTSLTGLTISSCYEYYVRLVCSATENSPWAGPFSFCTDVCEAVDQCNYTFNMTSDWWAGYSGATMTISQDGTTVAVIGPSFTTGPNQSVTVPMCSNEPFEVFWTNGGTLSFQVGLNIVNNFGQTLFNMAPGTGTPGTVLYTADMDCLVPACLAPENLTVLSTTDTSAELSWAGPATGNWQYYVVPSGDPAPGATTTPTGTTTTNPTMATGLLPATNYQYYVRVVCSGTQNSPWAGPFAFNTDACAPTAQCMYTVEMIDSWGDGWNGNTMSIIQGGVTVATFGSTFTTGVGPITVQVPLCDTMPFQVFWNTGGAFANEVGVTMYSPFAEEVFTKAPGTGMQGTTIFSSLDGASCTPPLCPKPQNLTVTNILEESVQLNWSEMGTATSWEIEIAALGTAPTGVGTVVTTNPFTWTTGLESGTTYQFYIRAICGGDNGNSNWAGPITFTTAIENDDCAGAIPAPVNDGGECVEFSTGTLTGATGSTQAQSCVTWMTIEYDVWYSFVAEATTHAVAITDAVGAFYQTVIYSGDNCGALTQLACGDDNQVVSGLTVGDTYYVRVYTTWMPDPTAVTSFHICVQTPEPPIAVSATQYTIPELVTEVLIDSDCALVSNITSSSAANFSGGASIGYFTQNGSSFPFEDGVVLTTGMLTEAPGPWPGTVGTDPFPWPGDAQLQAFNTAAGWPAQTNNATILEFDFIPTINQLTFDFLYASAEYGTFQCSFSDMFAFILTDVTAAGTPVNLAVVPGTSIPVSATYINDSQWNAGCASQNPEYFGQYNAANPNASSIGYIGQTVPMTASSPVIPGNTYHIKLVIADYADTILNSAVFISGGSFNIGTIDLGTPMLEFTGTAACDGEVITLDTEMDPDLYDFVWTVGGAVIPGETGPTLTISEQGLYGVTATFEGTDCDATGQVLIEYFEPIEVLVNEPNDLNVCDPDGFAEFNLEDNTPVLMTGVPGAAGFTVTYHLTQADAENAVGALASPYTNATQYQQTIYVRVESASECVGYKSFDLNVEDLTPTFTVPATLTLCGGNSGTITVVPGNFVATNPNVTFTWSHDGETLPDTGASITVTEPGVYDVIVNNSGCTATGSTTVNVSTSPTATIDYTGSPYCSNLASATVTHTGNTGGTYSAVATTGTGTLVINASTGTIDIAQSDAGTYNVTYALAATPSCDPFSITTEVVITEQPQTEFTYDSPTFCMNVTSNAVPTFNQDAAAGTFTVNAAGLTIDSATGAITPSTSQAGVYIVTNTIAAANGCADVFSTFEVTIIEAPVGTFSYSAPAYCQDGTDPSPIVTGAAGTFSADSDNLVIDSATGVIDLSASQAGNYIVYNTIAATADCDEVAFPVNVTIHATPSFDLGGPYVLCDATFATITVNANNFDTATATYSWTLDGVDTGDTGSSIQATGFGNYAVTVTTGAGCTSSLSVPVSSQTVGVDFEFMDECIDNVYTLMVMPIEGSFDPDTATYSWTGPDGFTAQTSMIEPTVTGMYNVTFVTPEGCVGANEFPVGSTTCSIQKGISPGDAGDNNFFDLSTLDVTSLSIFNRYGQEVYSRSMYTKEWEGQDKKGNELPTGTYFYTFERANGETQTGWIYINRQN